MNETGKAPPSDAIIKTTFVGRGEETKQLLDRLESVVPGTGQIAVVTGEAGIGKTRLAPEIVKVSNQIKKFLNLPDIHFGDIFVD